MTVQAATAALLEVQLAELKSAVLGATNGGKPGAPNDRFTLKIPYCKAAMKWRVIFNLDQPHLPPDVLLGKGEEAIVSLSALKTLRNWDIRQPRSLLDIVTEIVAAYKETQKQAVLAFPSERIHFEVSLVGDRPGTEFLLSQSAEHGAEIRIVVPLEIHEAANPSRGAENKICLFVAWRPNVKDIPTTSLITNAHFDNILGEVQMPPWRSETCLMDFIPAVEAVIRDGIADYAYRKAFVQHPLEYDSASFRKISFLLGDETKGKKDDTLMIAIISLPLTFMKDKPSIVLQSVVPGRGGKPIARSATNFPWTSRAPADESIKKLRGYFAEVRVDFAAVVEAELKQLTD